MTSIRADIRLLEIGPTPTGVYCEALTAHNDATCKGYPLLRIGLAIGPTLGIGLSNWWDTQAFLCRPEYTSILITMSSELRECRDASMKMRVLGLPSEIDNHRDSLCWQACDLWTLQNCAAPTSMPAMLLRGHMPSEANSAMLGTADVRPFS